MHRPASGLWRRSGTVLALAMLLALPVGTAAAQAQPTPDSLACRRQCGATSPDRAQNPRPVQVCLIRCSGNERFLAQQRRRGTPESSAGLGLAPNNQGSNLAAGVPQVWRPAPGAARSRTIVAYVGAPPSRGLGLSEPLGDRVAAHRGAETSCHMSNGNNPCRLLAETQEACLAVAQGVRAVGLAITADPDTYVVHHWAQGSGPDAGAAERAAMSDCGSRRAPGVRCRIVMRKCG